MRIIALIMVVMMLFLGLMPAIAQADRLSDLRVEYQQLKLQRRAIEERLLRLEGMFAERQAIEAEIKVEAIRKEQKAKTIEILQEGEESVVESIIE